MPVFEVTASVQVAFRLTALNWRPMNRTEHTFRTLRALDMKTTLSFATVIFGASVSVDVVFNVISGSYGLMALPTMVSTIILAPRVMVAARDYFSRMQLK